DLDIRHVDVEDITEDSATIVWETNLDADTYVEFGEDEDDLDDDEEDDDYDTDHEIELEDLEPDTRYYYIVRSCTPEGDCDEEGPFRFNTLREDEDDDDWDDGSDDWDDSWSDGYDSDWSDLYNQNAALLDSQSGSSTGTAAAYVTATQKPAGDTVEVVYAPVQYMQVEKEVCKFKLLWWCLWTDYVMEKIPLPVLTSGVQFVV
ncbi:fibronectin type III domain-containing protein, partial [Candidatus Woesearchaeota archaeon]|nr:fibronectin type III domain-containing protein [Candidatus Woesearchaeota archaeon]